MLCLLYMPGTILSAGTCINVLNTDSNLESKYSSYATVTDEESDPQRGAVTQQKSYSK